MKASKWTNCKKKVSVGKYFFFNVKKRPFYLFIVQKKVLLHINAHFYMKRQKTRSQNFRKILKSEVRTIKPKY